MYKIIRPNFLFAKRGVAFLLLAALIIPILSSCDRREEAVQLAKAGQVTAGTLSQLYESLILDTYDTWDYEAFLIGKDRQPNDPVVEPAAAAYQLRIAELNKRKKLAQNLAGTYKALLDLAGYDASADVSKAVGDLSSSIKGLGILPKSGVDPTAIFQMISEDLMKWKQSRDIRKGSHLIREVLEKLSILIEKESEVYRSIVRERGSQVKVIASFLIDKEKITTLELLQKVADSFGVKLIEANVPLKNDEWKNAFKALLDVRGDRIAQMSYMAVSDIQASLKLLATNHEKLERKQGLGLSELIQYLERAKVYVDEINKLRVKEKEAEK